MSNFFILKALLDIALIMIMMKYLTLALIFMTIMMTHLLTR